MRSTRKTASATTQHQAAARHKTRDLDMQGEGTNLKIVCRAKHTQCLSDENMLTSLTPQKRHVLLLLLLLRSGKSYHHHQASRQRERCFACSHKTRSTSLLPSIFTHDRSRSIKLLMNFRTEEDSRVWLKRGGRWLSGIVRE
jgi:hypothetical protein